MSEPPPLFKIKTPWKKCRHCGHRVLNSHDSVCPDCHVPSGKADRAVSTAMICLCIGGLVAVFLYLWPSIHEIAMEIVD